MRILLDLWGVLLDSETMFRGYRAEVARILSARFGGEPATWARAYDEAFLSYLQRVSEADWDADAWIDTIDRLDAENRLAMFALAGVPVRPDNPPALARELEAEGMSRVDARFPDARAAVERLRKSGHPVYVATGASETNARGALTGAKLVDLVDGLFTEHAQNAVKTRARYWVPIPKTLGVAAEDCVLVDDRLDYLEAAASVGIVAPLLDRRGAQRPEAMPPYVRAMLRHLAALPPWVEAAAPPAR